ncbi:hypothetical protein [Vibrio casei]|uniref:hypothetical protein n=1 Tax=Vibrio casei TaxID=673372 RepID=UPI003F97263C
MDEARNVKTGEIVTAEDLYFIKNPRTIDFCCDDCEVKLNPCSFLRGINIKKPYFQTFPGKPHIECEFASEATKRKKGQTERITTLEGFPLNYPNRFKLKKEGDSEPTDIVLPKPERKKRLPSDIPDGKSRGLKSTYLTTSFRTIVKEFFDFPHDRDRALIFDGVMGSTYKDVFQRIKNTLGKQLFRVQGKDTKVYYAPISWTRAEPENDVLVIDLNCGRWVDKKKVRSYYVKIDMNDWPQQTKTKFLNRYYEYLDLIQGAKNSKCVIAFVGYQGNRDQHFGFIAKDRRLIDFKIFLD